MQNVFWPPAAKISTYSLNVRAHNAGGAGRGGHYAFTRQPGEQWVGSVTVPEMVTTDALVFRAFLHSLRGKGGSFLMPIPGRALPFSGTIAADAAVDAESITASSAFAAAVNPGDWVALGDVQSSGQLLRITSKSGTTLDVRPRIRNAIASGTAIVGGTVYGRFRLDQDTPPLPLRLGRSSEITIQIAEAYSLPTATGGGLFLLLGV